MFPGVTGWRSPSPAPLLPPPGEPQHTAPSPVPHRGGWAPRPSHSAQWYPLGTASPPSLLNPAPSPASHIPSIRCPRPPNAPTLPNTVLRNGEYALVLAAWGSPAPFLLFFLPWPPCRDSASGLPGGPPASGALGALSPTSPRFPLPEASVFLGAPLSPRERGMGPGVGGGSRSRAGGQPALKKEARKSSYLPPPPPTLGRAKPISSDYHGRKRATHCALTHGLPTSPHSYQANSSTPRLPPVPPSQTPVGNHSHVPTSPHPHIQPPTHLLAAAGTA